MKYRSLNLLLAALLVLAAFAAVSPVPAAGPLTDLKGTIHAMDTTANTLTITPNAGGSDVVLNVDSSTKIFRNGHPVTLAKLQVGDKVDARYNPTGMLAARIQASTYIVALHGVIQAVDTGAGTLTVKPNAGASLTLLVNTQTVIKRNGKAAALTDLVVTDLVNAWYNPITMLASSINARVNLVLLNGVILSVDTGAGTLTVKPNVGANLTLTGNSQTVIKRNGKAAAFADLQVSDRVTIWYNPITLLASSITARVTLVGVNGVIQAVDTTANTLTITPTTGPNLTLNVNSNTKITRDGKSATLADLLVGDRVSAFYTPATLLASSIAAHTYLLWVDGSLKAVDTTVKTVTITPSNGTADIVLNVASTTYINANGHPAALADLLVGDHVDALYKPTGMTAWSILARSVLKTVNGTLQAVDTTAKTVTIAPFGGGANVVLNVTPSTVIFRNYHPAALAGLKVGDWVFAFYDPNGMAATSLSAVHFGP